MRIEAPTNCPSCSSELVWRNDQLYCENVSCFGKGQKKIEHFSKTLKIKGLGPATIEKLQLSNIAEIYELSLNDIVDSLGSEKMAEKLIKEIEASKKATLQEVLPAFSIPLIGKTAAEKVSKVLTDLRDLTEAACVEAGIGPKATLNLLEWFETEEYKLLPFSFKAKEIKRSKGIVCITGKLTSVKTKSVAESLLAEAGYGIKPSVTKDVTVVLNESGTESAKTKKAREYNIPIVTNLNQLIEENV